MGISDIAEREISTAKMKKPGGGGGVVEWTSRASRGPTRSRPGTPIHIISRMKVFCPFYCLLLACTQLLPVTNGPSAKVIGLMFFM